MDITAMDSFTHSILRRQSGQPGTNTGTSNSASNLVSTLIPVALYSGAFFLLFLILRRSQRRIYAPRSYLGALREQERSPTLPGGMFNWIGAFFKISDSYVLNHNSLDGYLFLRYLKIATAMCFVGCCITFPVLFPVNATGGGGKQQLDMISFSNIKDKSRYYAHVFVAWVYLGFIMYMVARESIYYINLRQAYFLSPLYGSRISSRTVLFNSVPNDYLDEAKLRRMFGKQLKNLWIATDCKDLEKLVEERDKVAMKLEGAETKLIKLANAARLKSIKKRGARHEEEHLGHNTDGESGSVAAQYINPKKRPTHRTKFLIGKKVDTINWSRSELERLLPQIEADRARHRAGDAKFVSSVFAEFYTQSDAQAAYQMIAHHQALHMSPRFIGINPDEVIWKNLRIKWWERIIRNIVTISFVCALIIFWAIPVAAVGAISNINSLDHSISWLKWIQKIPSIIMGVVTGLLPSVLLAVLMALLPIILRLMAKLGGLPSLSRVELRTQNFYFAFQVIQVFLVTTLASSAAATVTQITSGGAGSVTSILSQNLPKASNFYISYFILQGLTLSAGTVLQLVALVLYKLLGKLLDSTPRKMYKRFVSLSGLGWGTLFPVFTNLCVIAITYSIIAPLVLGFATIGLYLVYLAYRYNLLFVNNSNVDTKGLVYPRALQQTTVGVYLATICLIGLFGTAAAPGPIVLMVVFLVFIILFHVSLNSAIDPLLVYLPKSLETEEEYLLGLEDGHTMDGDSAGPEYPGKHPTTAHHGLAKNGTTSSSATHEKDLPLPPHKKPNFFTKWLRPDKYTDYYTMRRLVPRNFADIVYAPETERNAYYNPAVSSPTPMLWIPRDEMGVSRQEIRHTSRIIPMSDDDAFFDAKGNLAWNHEDARPPIWQEKVYY